HAVRVDAEPGLSLRLGLQMGPDMHAGRVEPDEERLAVPHSAVDEVDRRLDELRVDRLHTLAGERPGILALLPAPGAEARIVAGRVGRGRDALEDAARAELRPKTRVLRIVRLFRLLLGIEVIEVAEEHVEAVHGRQELVAVAKVVLAE